MRRYLFLIIVVCMFFFVLGCSQSMKSDTVSVSQEPAAEEPSTNELAMEEPVSDEPVTLTLYNYGLISDEMFEDYFVKPVSAAYPHITLDRIARSENPIPNLVVSGVELDIITGWDSLLDQFADHGLLADLTPHIKKQNIDLDRFSQTHMHGIELQSATIAPGEIYALPFGYNIYALFYNKDIFDQFGVDYPPDGMTWEDAIELGIRLTRLEEGVQYKGLDPEGIEKVGNSLSLPYVDAETERAMLDTDGWRRVFELVKRIHDIPGNDFEITNHSGTLNRFIADQNVAMLAAPEVLQSMGEAKFDWDVAEYPSFPESPNISGMAQTFVVQLSSISKHPDEAMKVMDLVTSEVVQLPLNQSGLLASVLDDPEIMAKYGEFNPLLEGKNIEAFVKTNPAPYVVRTRFASGVRPILEANYRAYLSGEVDVNTALRNAQEEADAYIESEKQ